MSPRQDRHDKGDQCETFAHRTATLHHADAFEWLRSQDDDSFHAVVTDPPYGVVEYRPDQVGKLRDGKGGVWRSPQVLDGKRRNPVPRFTTLTSADLSAMTAFFEELGEELHRVLVPGANVLVASNPLVMHVVTSALATSGLEPRGTLIRLVQTLRGGDRPKGAEREWPDVSVMPRSQWEPWIMMRKPLEGTVAENLREHGTGGWRRTEDGKPFGDVIQAGPARGRERELAPHPSVKPQRLMRQLVRASLPTGKGTILDPFAGSGSTLSAAVAMGLSAVGCEQDVAFYELACRAIPQVAEL